MSDILHEEQQYFNETLSFLKDELNEKLGFLKNQRNELISLNKEMFSSTAAHNLDEDKNIETIQYLELLNSLAHTADFADNRVRKYEKMLSSPYFGRFDFKEDGSDLIEKLYIGYFNLMNANGSKIYVLDWRTPVASMFYRFERGRASFTAHAGEVAGEILLKRQFKIENSELKYHFDTDVVVNDSLLCEVLSRSTAGKMKTIVETIQKEQDCIIRETKSDVVAVQGVAGSGKTNVALHRIAYLLYEGRKNGTDKNDILIVSPNNIFSEYIDEVLPTLGEEAANQTTLYKILKSAFKSMRIQNKSSRYELFVSNPGRRDAMLAASEFKDSEEFSLILDRYLDYYLRKSHDFEDVYFNKELLISSRELKALFLDNKINVSAESSLNRLNTRVMNMINEQAPKLHARIYELVSKNPKMMFEEEKNAKRIVSGIIEDIKRKLKKEFSIDCFKLYYELISDEAFFRRLAGDIALPKSIGRILSGAKMNLDKGYIPFDDACAMLYLKLKTSTNREHGNIKHVIVDEAQDYGTLVTKCFSMLYPKAKFTFLGDINQSIERPNGEGIVKVLDLAFKDKSVSSFTLTKSYRSSFEITEFANGIIGMTTETPFIRHSEQVKLERTQNDESFSQMVDRILHRLSEQKHNSIAVVTMSMDSAREIYEKTTLDRTKICFFGDKNPTKLLLPGVISILPAYMAKGLEFDAVIICGNEFRRKDLFTKKLLYVACTRALHKLYICEDAQDTSGSSGLRGKI